MCGGDPDNSHIYSKPNLEVKNITKGDVQQTSGHAPGRIYTCKDCDFWTRYSGSLTRHKLTHKPETSKLECKVCKHKVRTHRLLREHMKLVHGDGLLCPYCAKRFTSTSGLYEHMAREEGRYRFKCNICERTFLAKTHYEGHMNTHEKKKPFQCFSCGKGYAHHSRWRDHQEKCLIVAVGKDNVPDEYRIKRRKSKVPPDGQKNYVCPICNTTFKWSGSYYRHRKGHNRPYKPTVTRGTVYETMNK